VDRAREAAGLPSISALEFEATQRALVPSDRDEMGLKFQSCAAQGCEAVPLDSSGLPTGVVDRRWWCDQHKDQADPEDHLPPEQWSVDAAMGLTPGPVEKAQMVAEDERRQKGFRREREQLAAEAARLQELRDRQPKPTLPPEWGPP